MERVLRCDEEKLKKAEEIYYRRKNYNVTVPSNAVNNNLSKKGNKKVRKLVSQMFVCMLIYASVYFVQHSNYYFSNNVIKKVEEIFAYDINFGKKYNEFNNFIKNNKFFNSFFFLNKEQEPDKEFPKGNMVENLEIENTVDDTVITNSVLEENNVINNGIEENIVNDVEEVQVQTSTDLGTGGGISESISDDEKQMRNDAESIKNNYEIILPLRGIVTSRYGLRDIEPKFHTGIDIARNTGSEIISAMSGKVVLVTTLNMYGKVLKIQNGDLITLYAHCNQILVKEGEEIKIKQKIATVGSTGNSTGPHLHFEIIYCGRNVNPEYVMEFKE